MPENMADPTQIDLGEAQESDGAAQEETVVVIARNLETGAYTVETDDGDVPAANIDEALDIARTTLEGGTNPEAMRDEVASEIYPTDEGAAA